MMNNSSNQPHPFEPGRDELPSKPQYNFEFDRRKFFKLFGGGLAVAFVLHDIFSFAGEASSPDYKQTDTGQVNSWIHIGEDGIVSVYTGKVEVGQNIRTSLSQIVAEELMVPVLSIKMIMGDTDLVPYDAGTFGSRTTPQMGTQLRKAAATARQALVDMAAKKWNTTATGLRAENGMVVNSATNEKINYGALTKGEKLMITISDNVPVIAAKDWKVAGRSLPKIDQRNFITGKHSYVSDMKLPGMLYGKVLRAPSYGAKLIDADLAQAKNIPGVIVVKDGDFIGVATPDVKTATKAMQSIHAKWEEKKEHPSNANIFDYLVKNVSGDSSGRNSGTIKGDVDRGLTEADFKH